MREGLVQLAQPESARKRGVIPTFDEASAPRSEASLEPGEGDRSRPESGRLRAARPVAIGVGSDHPITRFLVDRRAIDESATDGVTELRAVLARKHEGRAKRCS